MIEGLILLAELVAFGLVLWYARRLDSKPPASSLGLFDMKPPDEVVSTNNKQRGRPNPHA